VDLLKESANKSNYIDRLMQLEGEHEVGEPYKWVAIADVMNKETRLDLTPEQWRRKCRYHKNEKAKNDALSNVNEKGVYKDILKYVGKARKIEELAELLKMPVGTLKGYLLDLRAKGYNIAYEMNGMVWLDRSYNETFKTIRVNLDRMGNKIRFAAVADTHMCSKWQQKTYLHNFYDECAKEDVKLVLHCGDWVDGDYSAKRREHMKEVFVWGADDQAEYVRKNFPYRKGIETKGITGNHDATYMALSGTNILSKICDQREDLENLGSINAKVWVTEKCDIDVFHPADGSAYAASYSIQKYLDSLQGGDKPRMLLVGHHHKAFYMPYRNVHAFEVPCFVAQTDWAKSKRLNYVVGAWMFEVEVLSTGEIAKLHQVYYPYYQMMRHDY